MSDISYYTQEGYDNLKRELHRLKTEERTKIANQIAEAREKGDLSENAEYDAAKDAQGLLELRISQMESMLANARILDDSNMDTSKALILSKIRLKNLTNNQVVTYQLVAANEANLKEGRISVDSPIGKGLLGKSVGEKAEIQVPAGKLMFEIIEISR
jgi:transcription elongation factor GreA